MARLLLATHLPHFHFCSMQSEDIHSDTPYVGCFYAVAHTNRGRPAP